MRVTRALAFASSMVVFGCSRSGAAPVDADATTHAPSSTAATATPSAPAAGPPGAGKPFGEECAADGECAAGACFHKRLHVPGAGREHRGGNDPVEPTGYCSLRCEDDKDCPVPPTSGRCGGRGMCKR